MATPVHKNYSQNPPAGIPSYPMSAHTLFRDYPSPVVPRCDDDDDDREDATPKPSAAPVGALIQKKFLEQRKIFLWGAVTDETAKDLTEKLLYLESDAPGKPITFYINSPGGSVTAGMAVYDTIKLISSPVTVVVTGMAASMGSILLSAAKKGNRYIYPHARVLIHQPLITGRMVGPASDINIQAIEMEKLRKELNQILATASGQSYEKVAKDSDRDFYLNAEESIAYGLADHIVDKL
ncbi:ATP-dependent Clp protease proteolytic subunit 1 [Lacunisphaera limnophila]|uniref:ATP-dependent Clp protease proteolytic subunit n=2 Tax=Lacunisphaera limnophila TaxID=1838286 RepID=A0A1D8AUV2_9BACT|nr:ATP-dependent Clp protease proteolytic subunit 1 [Lacunisphaera limnophila]